MFKEDFEEGPEPNHDRTSKINLLLEKSFGLGVVGNIKNPNIRWRDGFYLDPRVFSDSPDMVAEIRPTWEDENIYYAKRPIGVFLENGYTLALWRKGFLGRFIWNAVKFKRLYEKEFGVPLNLVI